MPLKFDLKKLELGKLNPGLNREQLIALGVTALIVVFCVTVVTWSLGVRSEARAELVEKLDALALLEARVGGGAKARGPVRNPAAPASAFLTTQTQGLAGAELQAYLAQLASAQNAEVVSSGLQPTGRDDTPETIRLQATLTTTIGSLQGVWGGAVVRAMPNTPGQNRPWASTLKSAVTIIWASGWVWTGMESTKPTRAPTGAATGLKAMSAPRRKVNSALRSGRTLPPSPVPCGSPVWAMKSAMTRWNTTPS